MSHLGVRSHDKEHVVMQDMSVADSDMIELEPVVQRVCGVTHADGEISGDARLGQSLEVTIEPERQMYCSMMRQIPLRLRTT